MQPPPITKESRDAESIFAAALAVTQSNRSAYLREVCGGDAALEERISALLESHGQLGGFLPEESWRLNRTLGRAGMVIGPYRLIQELGQGGCGAVYLAEQSAPIRRRVALKIIKAGMDTAQVITRFEAERQALAMMDHPNIAKVFDAGCTDTGRPYFVMELVDGKKITGYCAEHQLSINNRLHLFLQVCDAVQHAHQKGIIHRDLKPLNIMVSEKNSAPAAQVIDFGIAKAIQGKLTAETIHTLQHQFLGTPAYMSPEQADLSPDIDTRTDIYSLGVLLYELLTGRPPFDNEELLTAGLDEMRRIIDEVEPKRPSHIKRTTDDLSLDSDLDWITMKCLEKDRACRYESVSALAADIVRYLRHEPVAARSPSAAYRLSKLWRRHRIAFIAAVAISATLIVAAITASVALVRERAASKRERIARAEADKQLQASLRFVNDIFNDVAPQIRRTPGAVPAQQNLGQAVLRLLENVHQSAAINPEVRNSLAAGLVYLSMIEGNAGEGSTVGDFDSALQHGREAEKLFASTRSSDLAAKELRLLAQAKQVISSSLRGLGRFEEAAAVLLETQPLLTRLEQFPEHQNWARTRRNADLADGGFCLLLAGSPAVALTNYLLPVVGSGWAQSISTNSGDLWDVEVLATTFGQLTVAYDLLGNFPAMTQAAVTGMQYQAVLLAKEPTSSRNQGLMAAFRAVQGHGQMRAGSTNRAIEALNLSRAEIEDLVKADPRNEFPRIWRTEISAIQARALAVWSAVAHSSSVEREQRFLAAESYLAEAEQFARVLKGNPRLPALKAARLEIGAMRAPVPDAYPQGAKHPPPADHRQ